MAKDFEAALDAVRVRAELAKVRLQKRMADEEASKPTVYLPEAPRLDARPVPNGVLRSALFAALGKVKKEDRKHFDRQRLASLNGIDVHFTGKQLDQYDLDLWLVLMHIGRETPLGFIVELSLCASWCGSPGHCLAVDGLGCAYGDAGFLYCVPG